MKPGVLVAVVTVNFGKKPDGFTLPSLHGFDLFIEHVNRQFL
jgi:hypothetical protein